MNVQELFPETFDLVTKAHKGIDGGHDIHHATRVATWAQRIAMNEWGDQCVAKLAGLAGLCHNADRLIEHQYGHGNAPESATRELLTSWLETSDISVDELEIVLSAVLNHGAKNSANDSRVKKALADADKVVNMALDLIIRSGQLYHDLPALDHVWFVNDPEATYLNPKSSLKDIWYSPAEWVDPSCPFCFCTSLGWRIGEKRAQNLTDYIQTLRAQMEEDGIVFKE